ncbi:MAG: TIR domain-containing protein [Planctomycetes bacterium]|nr:TIR domain-containing protein [Planctomycetota bacterium]
MHVPGEAELEVAGTGPGTLIQDRYRLREELGRGGMGRVFLASDGILGRFVAIKVVAGVTASLTRPLEDALAREARLGAGLNHPAIAAVYDFGFHQGHAFTVFEYVDGDALRDVLRARGRISLEEALPIIGSVAHALDFAHGHGIVHCDLKPENIRASRQGRYKILDLGLAQQFRHQREWATFAGTPAYASPEQAAGLPSDGRSDQYSLAVIVYEMLVGSRPFDHENPWRLLEMHQRDVPAPPSSLVSDLPGAVCASILRALEKDPNARFASCEEFATALGSREHLDERNRVVMDGDDSDCTNIYVCHAGDNSPIARQLAHAVELQGYSCWHYERDALPGISYVAQTSRAIRRSDAVVLIVSAESISSADVRREVREAYHLGRPFLPVLLGITRQEFHQRQPEWQPVMGGAATVDVTGGNFSQAASRLVRTLELWEIPPRPRETARLVPQAATAKRKQVLSDGSRKIWASDANQIEIYDLSSVVFRNEMVDDFLERRNKFFLSASKGLGKTLLLTFKRSLLSQTYQHPSGSAPAGGVIFVPQGRPFLDFMSDVRSLSRQHEQLLSDLLSAKRMWNLALSVSALSHHASLIAEGDEEEIALFPRRMQQWLAGASTQPTVVFKELLGQSVRDINQLIDKTENYLDQRLRQIHGGTFFFIDKVDQALRQLSQDAWVHVQAGLIEAAWDIMNANSHIKVHASIRQEAFCNYESDIKANLFGATTMIRYSEEELQQMLNQLAYCYEGCESFQDFTTLSVVKHPRRPFPEDSFRYVRRHTLGRPRDLVIIASELSAKRKTMNESQFCNLVNDTSSVGLVANVFNEMHVFLNCLVDRGQRQRFFALLPHNILTRQEVMRIFCRFNGLSEEDGEICKANCVGMFHPFCDLYRVGLLGTVVCEPSGDKVLQQFKQPHHFFSGIESALPESPCYLVHPALDAHIGQFRTGQPYNLFQHVIVGDGQVWEDYFGVFCSFERALFGVEDSGAVDAAYRLLNEARIILASDRGPHLRSRLEASDNLKLLRTRCHEASYDDLGYWLEELVEFGER